MNETPIIEPLGPCPITGYPLIAVHEASGTHAGLALAQLEEVERLKNTIDDQPVPRLRLEEVATLSEVFRSWTELLIFATIERLASAPGKVDKDYMACRDLLQTRHHYDTARIIASVHIAAVEYLRLNDAWAKPELVLVPDVGVDHVRTSAQAAVVRLAGTPEAIPEAVEMLRHTYLQRLAVTA
jgi:hypothetical protein